MPRKGRKASGKGGDSCVIPFHFLNSTVFAAGATGFTLSPSASVSPRALAEADAWAHFRVKSFAFRLLPTAVVSVLRGVQTAGYVGGVQDTSPTTLAQVTELLPSVILPSASTVPTEWVRPSKAELAGCFPWYKTIPGTADATEESPGSIVLTGTVGDVFQIEFRGTFEFKTAVSTGNTPLEATSRLRLREERVRMAITNERALLLKILGFSPSGAPVLP